MAAANALVVRPPRCHHGCQVAWAAVLMISALPSSLASAQTTGPDAAVTSGSEDRRKTLFQEGVDLASGGRWADARTRFADALAIRVSPRVLFSLAETEEHLGLLTEAMTDYGRSARTTPVDPEVVRLVEEARQRLERRVPQIRLVAAPGIVTAVTVDDRPATIDTPLSVDPGEHRIGVTAADGSTVTITVAVAEAQRLTVPLRIEEVKTERGDVKGGRATAAASTTPLPPDESIRSPWKTVGWIAGAVGLVGLAVGGAFGIDAKVQLDASNRSGCSGDVCNSQGTDARHQAIDDARASTVAFVAGGALTAAGVVLVLLSPSRRGASAAMSAAPAPGGGALFLSGSWR